MAWQTLIFSRIILSYILFPVFFKKAADLPFKIKQQFWIYSFCVLFALIYAFYAKNLILSTAFLLVIIIGLANSLAFYFNLRAVNISQSKSSVFSISTDFIAIILAFIFLKEYQYFNQNLAVGLALIIISAGIFAYGSRQDLKKTKKFFLYVLGYSSIWGIIAVFERLFAFNGLPFATFGLAWYGGSWLGALLILQLTAKAEEKTYKLTGPEKLNSLGVGSFIWLSMLLGYLALRITPLLIYGPFFIISQIIFPVLIGLFVFKEIKKVKTLDIIAFALAIISGTIIAFSF